MNRIGEFRSSENNSAWGRPGDQIMPANPGAVFDGEVRVRYFSGDEFKTIWRPVEARVAEGIARNMEAAARNVNVGYSQNNGAYPRTTFYEELLRAGGDASQISRPCNGDCSAGTAALLKVEGVPVSADMWTGNAPEQLRATRMLLEIDITCAGYEKYLMRGDILYRPGHMAICLDDGELAVPIPVTATGDVWQRLTPGVSAGSELYAIDKGAAVSAYLPAVDINGRAWTVTAYNGRRGWSSSRYLDAETEVVTTASCYIRSAPSLSGKVLAVAEPREVLTSTGNAYEDIRGVSWYQVIVGTSSLGWISGKYSIRR